MLPPDVVTVALAFTAIDSAFRLILPPAVFRLPPAGITILSVPPTSSLTVKLADEPNARLVTVRLSFPPPRLIVTEPPTGGLAKSTCSKLALLPAGALCCRQG